MPNKHDDFMKNQGISLEHYGVKGMKWGVTREEGGGGGDSADSGGSRSGITTTSKRHQGSKTEVTSTFEPSDGGAGGASINYEEENLTDEEIEEREKMAAAILGIDIEKFKEYTGDKTLYAKHLKGAEWTDDRGSFMFKAANKVAELTGDTRPALQRNVENHVAAKKFMQNIFNKPSEFQDKKVTIPKRDTNNSLGRDLVNDVLGGGGQLVIDTDDD